MSKRIDDVVKDIKDIKESQVDTKVKLAEYNTLLAIHIKGVQDLDARVKPIEEHVSFLRGVIKAAAIAASGGGALLAIARYFLIK